MRADKYLWCVRLYKSRAIASEAIRSARMKLHDQPIKPSKELLINDVFTIYRPPVLYTYRVKGIPKSRVGAKLVAEYLEDLTPESEKAKLRGIYGGGQIVRDPGTGRPTKKERRELDQFLEYEDFEAWEDDEEWG